MAAAIQLITVSATSISPAVTPLESMAEEIRLPEASKASGKAPMMVTGTKKSKYTMVK